MYAKQVPIVLYEDLAPYVERMLRGGRHVLTADRTSWFAKEVALPQMLRANSFGESDAPQWLPL